MINEGFNADCLFHIYQGDIRIARTSSVELALFITDGLGQPEDTTIKYRDKVSVWHELNDYGTIMSKEQRSRVGGTIIWRRIADYSDINDNCYPEARQIYQKFSLQ